VDIGVGRMKASAARSPRTSPVPDVELIRLDESVFLKFDGSTFSESVLCALEKEGEFMSSDARDWASEKAPPVTALSSIE
jgi:hypothetical protein